LVHDISKRRLGDLTDAVSVPNFNGRDLERAND